MVYPSKILIKDEEGGYIVATYSTTEENADEEYIPIYEYKEYYHDRESAIRDF